MQSYYAQYYGMGVGAGGSSSATQFLSQEQQYQQHLQASSSAVHTQQLQDGYTDYQVSGFFNPRTGRFESRQQQQQHQQQQQQPGDQQNIPGATADLPTFSGNEVRSYVDSKQYRHMNMYFDYKSWVESRNSAEYEQQEAARKARKPTKKEIEEFKKQKKERQKTKRRWLFKD
jgi:hypothetical protein